MYAICINRTHRKFMGRYSSTVSDRSTTSPPSPSFSSLSGFDRFR